AGMMKQTGRRIETPPPGISEGIAKAQASREAVKDRRLGPSSSDDGYGSLSRYGVAVVAFEDRLIPERESAKGPAYMVADPPEVLETATNRKPRGFAASRLRCRMVRPGVFGAVTNRRDPRAGFEIGCFQAESRMPNPESRLLR